MRVLLVNHTFNRNEGQGRVNAEVARALLEHGHHVTLMSGDRRDAVTGLDDAEFLSVPPIRFLPTRLLRHLTFGYRTTRALRRQAPQHDLVIANGGMTFAAADVNLCHFVHRSWRRHPKHPLKASDARNKGWALYQAAYSKQAEVWERNAYRRAGHVVAVSDLVRDQLINEVGVEASRVSVIENGFDPLTPEQATTSRGTARKAFDANDDNIVIFFAAELRTPRKNFDTLLKALKRLPENVLLVAAGEYRGGPYWQLIREAGLDHRVRLLGFRRDVRDLYAGGDIFALAAYYDPCPVSIGEAMAAGLPIVTATSVGSSAMVLRKNAGVVVPDADDTHAIAAAIRGYVEHPELRHQHGQNGRAAADSLSWSRVGERYVNLLETVAEEKQAERRSSR